MLRLCLKDIKVSRFYLAILLLFFVVQSPVFFLTSTGYMLFSVVVTAFLAVGVTIIDDCHRFDVLFLSLPLKRVTVVRARYLTAFFAIFVGWCLSVGYGLVLDMLLPGPAMDIKPLMTLEWLFFFVGLLAVIVCMFLPFYFRYGIGKGSFAFFSSVLLLALVLAGAIRLTAHLAGFPPVWVDPSIQSTPELTGTWAIQAAGQILQRPSLAAMLAVLLASVLYLSLKLSCVFYERRDF